MKSILRAFSELGFCAVWSLLEICLTHKFVVRDSQRGMTICVGAMGLKENGEGVIGTCL